MIQYSQLASNMLLDLKLLLLLMLAVFFDQELFPFLLLFDVGLAHSDHVKVGHDEEQEQSHGEEVQGGHVRVDEFAELEQDSRPIRYEHVMVDHQE